MSITFRRRTMSDTGRRSYQKEGKTDALEWRSHGAFQAPPWMAACGASPAAGVEQNPRPREKKLTRSSAEAADLSVHLKRVVLYQSELRPDCRGGRSRT